MSKNVKAIFSSQFAGVSAKLLDGDSVIATATGVTQGAQDPSYWDADFAAVAAGRYRAVFFSGGVPVYASFVTIDAADGEYLVDEILAPSSGGGADHSEQLDRIEEQTSRITGTPIEIVSNVGEGGVVELYKGSDYRVRSNTGVSIPVSDVGGSLHAILTNPAVTAEILFGAGTADQANEIVGTISSDDVTYADDVMTIVAEFTKENLAAAAVSSQYVYHIKNVTVTDADESVRISGKLSLDHERARV